MSTTSGLREVVLGNVGIITAVCDLKRRYANANCAEYRRIEIRCPGCSELRTKASAPFGWDCSTFAGHQGRVAANAFKSRRNQLPYFSLIARRNWRIVSIELRSIVPS
jgi:hypothetical protein